ncbi:MULTISPECIES: polyhydroxyalkanoic acid system family protein [Niastella]|uniref:Polyhydroxyalkanoic acid system family protein n=1 Tax=Niastella soli TaxID=2821487 RepID=A0ABS3YYF7_9BACT|nr:polyhydroxyalkanoic acid system family protein [Niastella soli]MBO9202450.1 polyhydroxyalkanoic acid system family protein [Niastella soli]
MSNLSLNIPHAQTQEEALNRVKQLLGRLQEEQKGTVTNVQENWNGPNGSFSFSAKGFNIAGTIQVRDNEVHLESDLPFAVSFFKGQIAALITEKAKALLA